MNGFEIGKFVVIGVYTNTEEQASVSPVDNFVVPELAPSQRSGLTAVMGAYLDKVRLVLLVPWGNYSMHFPT